MLHLQKSDERDASPCIHAPAPHDTIYKLKIAVEDSVTAPQISIGLPRGALNILDLEWCHLIHLV
jgi:hypothetical protein